MMRRAPLLLLLAAACAEPQRPTLSLVTRRLAVLGDSQRGRVHALLPAPIVATARDSAGRAVAGQLVVFRVLSGGGSVWAGIALTNDSGTARERWTLGDTAGVQTLEARAVDQATGEPLALARVVALAEPGPLALARFAARQLRARAAAVPLGIVATDAWGNRVAAPAPAALDTGLALTLGADSAWRLAVPGPGRWRAALAAETCTVLAHVPPGAFEYVAHRGDTTFRYAGTLAFVRYEALMPPDSLAAYRVPLLLGTRHAGADSASWAAGPLEDVTHALWLAGTPARSMRWANPLTPSRNYLWYVGQRAGAWLFAVGREALDTDTAFVRP